MDLGDYYGDLIGVSNRVRRMDDASAALIWLQAAEAAPPELGWYGLYRAAAAFALSDQPASARQACERALQANPPSGFRPEIERFL